jgi:Domain of unknown function (DUF4037)
MVPPVSDLLRHRLPDRYRGHPVRFPVTWDEAAGHRVEVSTVPVFAVSRLGVDPCGGLDVYDWLSLTGQSVLEVTAGPVFADRTEELGPVRELLGWYPPDVERYVLAAAWQRVAQQMPFLGRTADRGDELGSRLVSAELADDLMWLAFALCRCWPPYLKWRGTMFGALPIAPELTGSLTTAVTAPRWRDREEGIAASIEVLLAAQRALGLPATRVRCHPVLRPALPHAQRPGVVAAGGADHHPVVAALPRGVGCVERWADNVDVLSSSSRRAGLRPVYRAWSAS